jgi:hypothetical protein
MQPGSGAALDSSAGYSIISLLLTLHHHHAHGTERKNLSHNRDVTESVRLA